MAWPNTAHPGEPADSRPWHWVARVEDAGRTALPIGWNGALRQWMVWDGSTVGPEEAARRFTYLGPCLTPAETEAALEAAKAAAQGGAPAREPRGLDALVASATPPPPPAMVYRKDAIRNHLLIFAGTLAGAIFLAEKILGVRQ
jgi:hypothetical protein